jgi:hypothetical protein
LIDFVFFFVISCVFEKKMAKKGFTVGSIILLTALVCAVVIVLIPIFSTAREKATQRATMSDMMKWAKAIESYRNDHFIPPTNPRGKLNYKKAIVSELTPYLKALRIVDWWGYPYWIWTGENNEQFGIKTKGDKDFIIASLGKKGTKDDWIYDPSNPESGYYKIKKKADFENDIILWNFKFIHCPAKRNNEGP